MTMKCYKKILFYPICSARSRLHLDTAASPTAIGQSERGRRGQGAEKETGTGYLPALVVSECGALKKKLSKLCGAPSLNEIFLAELPNRKLSKIAEPRPTSGT